jgi:hypothetical protein
MTSLKAVLGHVSSALIFWKRGSATDVTVTAQEVSDQKVFCLNRMKAGHIHVVKVITKIIKGEEKAQQRTAVVPTR